MNKSIVYQRCQQIKDKMAEDGFYTFDRIQWIDIEPYIAKYCGADPRTLQKYRKYLVYFGFFKETRAGIFEWCERDEFGTSAARAPQLKPRKQTLACYWS